MFFTMILMLVIFTAVAKGYKKREGEAPKGIQSAMEPLILFVKTK
jgi:F-type H+-transporting ATPase subunit a